MIIIVNDLLEMHMYSARINKDAQHPVPETKDICAKHQIVLSQAHWNTDWILKNG